MSSDRWAILVIALVWMAGALWTAGCVGYRRGERSRLEEESWLDGTDAGGADATRPDPMPVMPPSTRAPGASVPAWPAGASSWDDRMPEGEEQLIPQLTQDMARLKMDVSQEFDRILDQVWADAPPAARHLRAVE